jgi:hypothetical protein
MLACSRRRQKCARQACCHISCQHRERVDRVDRYDQRRFRVSFRAMPRRPPRHVGRTMFRFFSTRRRPSVATDNISATMRSKARTHTKPAPAASSTTAMTNTMTPNVKDRTQSEIGQKRQRADKAAGIASQHESFERSEAGRAQGAGQIQPACHGRDCPTEADLPGCRREGIFAAGDRRNVPKRRDLCAETQEPPSRSRKTGRT